MLGISLAWSEVCPNLGCPPSFLLAAMKALLCQLLALIASVQSELTNVNFAKCSKFFYKAKAPTGFEATYATQLKYICQRFQNVNRFATLYQTEMRMPIYSAYILNPKGHHRPQGPDFKLEPQLVDGSLNATMLTEAETLTEMNKLPIPQLLLADSQALNSDYVNSGYVKGHLNPVADQKFVPSKCATCTLTNAVPMDPNFNNGRWKSYEMHVRKQAQTLNCDKMYVLRGVIPGNNWIRVNGADRVNIPGQVWGAYCCVKKNGELISKGAIADNIKEVKIKIKETAVTTLEKKLPGNIKLFDQC